MIESLLTKINLNCRIFTLYLMNFLQSNLKKLIFKYAVNNISI